MISTREERACLRCASISEVVPCQHIYMSHPVSVAFSSRFGISTCGEVIFVHSTYSHELKRESVPRLRSLSMVIEWVILFQEIESFPVFETVRSGNDREHALL